jgi:hypothetical protein
MKTILFVGLIALMVLLVAPAMAADAPLQVKGQVANSMTITPAYSSIDFGDMNVGYTPAQTVAVDMTFDSPITSWSVDCKAAASPVPISAGYMDNGVTALINPLKVSNGGAYQNLHYMNMFSGSGSSPYTGTAYFKQEIVDGDATGNFKINLEFTGTIT